MNINRKVHQRDARHKVGFCLDALEKNDFLKDIKMETTITTGIGLTMEEVIGALVASEQYIDRHENK